MLLAGCHLTTNLFFKLAPGLTCLSGLQHIDLSCLSSTSVLILLTRAVNQLEDQACVILGQVLMCMPTLKLVDLHCRLFTASSQQTRFDETPLNTPDHAFTDAGMHEMLEGLASPNDLDYLNLFGSLQSEAHLFVMSRRQSLQRAPERTAATEATRVVA